MKAQASEFIGIILLVIVIVIFVIFNRLGNSQALLGQTESSVEAYHRTYMSLTAIIFPAITINATPIGEILGVTSCFNYTNMTYGLGRINISYEVGTRLDGLLGADNWQLELSSKQCFTSSGITFVDCSPREDMAAINIFYPLPCRQASGEGKLFVGTY